MRPAWINIEPLTTVRTQGVNTLFGEERTQVFENLPKNITTTFPLKSRWMPLADHCSQEWSGIAMSDDGSKMVASAYRAKLWISGAAGAIGQFDRFQIFVGKVSKHVTLYCT